MSKRFGRNQKRALLKRTELISAERDNWRRHYQQQSKAMHELRGRSNEIIDLGLRVVTDVDQCTGDFRVQCSIMDKHVRELVSRQHIHSARDKSDFINYMAHHIARVLVRSLEGK